MLERPFALVAGGYFLSDAEWISATNGWGPVERDTSNGENAAGDGGVITLNGRSYSKGIGAHALSTIVIGVGGSCDRVSFDYGIDDEIASGGSVAFEVRADGVRQWHSGTMTATTATGHADVDITGAGRIELVQDPLGHNGQDHGDWANAWVRCS